MKQFNLEEYLRLKEEGKEPKIVTREGSSVRVLCTDRESKDGYTVIALVKIGSNEYESVMNYRPDGAWINYDKTKYDLFFAPVKHEGWVNIYQGFPNLNCTIYDSEQEALNVRGTKCIATAKIEWTE